MPLKILSAALIGIDAQIIEVESSLGGGDFGQISIVGLPDTSVAEAKERVRSAIINSSLIFPKRKITVNLAPAHLKKIGPSYDLPIALSVLSLKYRLAVSGDSFLVVGELSLSGDLRRISGAVAIALAARQKQIKYLFLPAANAQEAGLVSDLTVFPVRNLKELVRHFSGGKPISPFTKASTSEATIDSPNNLPASQNSSTPDISHIKGQKQAKRALEIALAGGHNLLFSGPPGSGKTTLAQAAAGLLPPLTAEERLEVIKIYNSTIGSSALPSEIKRPFRSPHHLASAAALIGGGRDFKPGEVTLAHLGILFLDEFPEFSRPALECLRQPLESGEIFINRAGLNLVLPARFILIAAMNPCPCGLKSDGPSSCTCSPERIKRYCHKLSGPILDRIDLHLEINNLKWYEIYPDSSSNQVDSFSHTSIQAASRIKAARELQKKRLPFLKHPLNAYLPSSEIKKYCPLDEASRRLLQVAAEKMKLSNRSYFKTIKIARTIADIDCSLKILESHLAEALRYRPRN